jgi:hypothetical protein
MAPVALRFLQFDNAAVLEKELRPVSDRLSVALTQQGCDGAR